MGGRRRRAIELDGDREARALAGTLGADLRATRRRRRMTLEELGARVGLSRSRLAEIEAGDGEAVPLSTWVRLGKALDRPFVAGFSRDLTAAEPADAGHLAAQELILRLARSTGRTGTFEVPTRPANPSRSIDVLIRDDRHGVLLVIEIWNRLDDLGAAARSTTRKLAEASDLAGFGDRRAAAVWLLVDTAANRALVRRYPEILRSRFPGSSARWVRAVVDGAEPPLEPGIAWIDPRAGRVIELRLRTEATPAD